MKMKKAVLSLALASAMLIAGCSGSGKGNEAAAGTKNADGKYDPVLTIRWKAWKQDGDHASWR